MVYTFNPSMEGQDRWNPEFQKPCLQKAKQNKQMNNEPPPTPQKTFCTNVPKAHFLSAPHLWTTAFWILNHTGKQKGADHHLLCQVRSWK